MVGERDIEVRDLAYKDLLPGQILRAQHALQALQDHLTEQHMRQLRGNEPLQAILGAISKKEEYDKHYDQHYVQIDSLDPDSLLQQQEERMTRKVTLQEEILQDSHHYSRELMRS